MFREIFNIIRHFSYITSSTSSTFNKIIFYSRTSLIGYKRGSIKWRLVMKSHPRLMTRLSVKTKLKSQSKTQFYELDGSWAANERTRRERGDSSSFHGRHPFDTVDFLTAKRERLAIQKTGIMKAVKLTIEGFNREFLSFLISFQNMG